MRDLAATSALAHLGSHATLAAPGIALREETGLALAQLFGAGADAAALAAAARVIGVGLPHEPNTVSGSDPRALWIAPGQWLLVGVDAGTIKLAEPGPDLIDRSDGLVSLRVSGDNAADLLSRGVPLDLHPSVSGAAHVARTVMGSIDIVLEVLIPGRDYRILVERSLAHAAWTWLADAASAYKSVATPVAETPRRERPADATKFAT